MSTMFPGEISIDGVGFPTGLADMSAVGLLITTVAFFILALVRGWVVVKTHHDALLARAVAAEKANERLSENNSKLIMAVLAQSAVGETVEKLVGSLHEVTEGSGGSS
ncbi:membrane protein [Arthrobacter phage Rizwana]|nr:membrane protein [Arthrobacter phage Rizwana]